MSMQRYLQSTLHVVTLLAIHLYSMAQAKPVVGLDCCHNNEATPHYTWSQTGLGGFSQLAGLIVSLGADTVSLKSALDATVLSSVNILIIVDPDTTTEASSPEYLSTAEDNAIDTWVQNGGVLMLLANNGGNCEFTHLNELSASFGIRFNADTYSGGYNLTPLPAHPFFAGCDTLYIKDISTLTLSTPAQAVLTISGKSLMTTSIKGRGTVFALGDPWLYNEYIGSADNRICGRNVMEWLIAQMPAATRMKQGRSMVGPKENATGVAARTYLPNGRMLPSSERRTTRLRLHGHRATYSISRCMARSTGTTFFRSW